MPMAMLWLTVNRRLDEWVEVERIDVSQRVEEPQNKDVATAHVITDLPDTTDRKITRNQKRKHDEINHVQKVLWMECYDLSLIALYVAVNWW